MPLADAHLSVWPCRAAGRQFAMLPTLRRCVVPLPARPDMALPTPCASCKWPGLAQLRERRSGPDPALERAADAEASPPHRRCPAGRRTLLSTGSAREPTQPRADGASPTH
jgi:hypothetical protein